VADVLSRVGSMMELAVISEVQPVWIQEILNSYVSASRDRGVPKPTSECAACPSPDGSSAWASAKGGSEVAGDRRERGGDPAAFVFVPRPGRVRLQ
jgi:hypothetical protein